MNGAQLYEIVEAYERLGIHRAASDVDRATIDWVDALLESRGLTTTRIAAPFDRYATSSSLIADGVEIEHLPFFYEWIGSVDTTDVEVVLADAHAGGRDGDLDDTTNAAGRDALIVATEHPEGSLVAVNREARLRDGRPTVLVAGRDHDRLAAASRVHLQLDARIESAATTNLEARNGIAGEPILLTTPLTGWFGCAGERGTGLAVLLDLVERFADLPLLVLATGGHELDYLGVRQWVASTTEQPRAIVHVGASVAVDTPDDDGVRRLVATRLAMTDAGGDTAARIGAALEPAAFVYHSQTDRWIGESEVFCEMARPMLSFTGSGIDFHTPEDTASRVTSPASLELVATAIGDAVDALLDRT
ncbi:MAG: hypothetical protein AAGE98_07205 [Actinomycetota bacterium]